MGYVTEEQHSKILFQGSTASLGDVEKVRGFLATVVEAIGMRPLDEPRVYDVPIQLAKLAAIPREDEGGVTAEGFAVAAEELVVGSLVLSTSHIAIHTWPLRERGVLDIYSCRGFSVSTVLNLLRASFPADSAPMVRDLSYALRDEPHPWERQGVVVSADVLERAAEKIQELRGQVAALEAYREHTERMLALAESRPPEPQHMGAEVDVAWELRRAARGDGV